MIRPSALPGVASPGLPTSHAPTQSPTQLYPHQAQQAHEQSFHFPASPHLPAHPQPIAPEYPAELHMRNIGGPGGTVNYNSFVPQVPHHASELDAHYWKNMFIELGFGENGDPQPIPSAGASDHRGMPQYIDTTHHNISHSQQNHQHQGHLSYSHLHHASQPNY